MGVSQSGERVGRIVGLWRYPVKSMGAEALTDVEVSWNGFVGDRRWAFIRADSANSGFPWLTLRKRPELRGYQPSFVDPSEPDSSSTVVRTPAGEVLDVTDPALAVELAPEGARVIKQDRGVFDAFPLSLVTTQALASLGEIAGADLEAQRFRPNLLVDAEGGASFPEDDWVGSVLRIGGFKMRIDKRDGRCIVITMDPETAERNNDVLRAVAREREGCLGVYGSAVSPGHVALDDPVCLE